jgi:superoxide reductase
MTKLNEVYKCELCGNMVIVVHDGAGELVCCGQPMKRMEEQTADSATEKHVPVIEKKEEGILVKVGSVPHPMEEKHYIEWIELTVDGTVLRRFLKPQEAPEALFKVKGEKLSAREYCNVHGLWRS